MLAPEASCCYYEDNMRKRGTAKMLPRSLVERKDGGEDIFRSSNEKNCIPSLMTDRVSSNIGESFFNTLISMYA